MPKIVLNSQVTCALDFLSQIHGPIKTLEQEIRRLALENDTLKRENVALKQENTESKAQVISLVHQKNALRLQLIASASKQTITVGQRMESSKSDHQTISTQELEVQKLKVEVQKLEERLKLQEPLVKCAIKIRQRFYEHCREHLGFGVKNEAVVSAGNIAAHRGDYSADCAMVLLLESESDIFANEYIGNDNTTADMRSMVKVLYGMTVYYHTPPLPLIQVKWLNMGATVSSISSYRARRKRGEQYQDADLQTFATACAQALIVGSKLTDKCEAEGRSEQETDTMVDECPKLAKCVEELGMIMHLCIQRRQNLKRQAIDAVRVCQGP